MKTSELKGADLDYWVGKAVGLDKEPGARVSDHPDRDSQFAQGGRFVWSPHPGTLFVFRPSTSWEQGGPIIERKGIHLTRGDNGEWESQVDRENHKPMHPICRGTTALVAAMRACVASEFGNEVEPVGAKERT